MEENKLKTNTNGNKSEDIIYGGIDAEEVLSDGTKLIFISGKNIESAYKKYSSEAKKIFGKRWSLQTRVNIDRIVKYTSLVAGMSSLSCIVNKKFLEGIAIAGALLPAAFVTYSYSHYRDKNIIRDYGYRGIITGYDGTRSFDYSKLTLGPGEIAERLGAILNYQDRDALNNGVLIIIRPKNKWDIEDPRACPSVIINQNEITDEARKYLERTIEEGL